MATDIELLPLVAELYDAAIDETKWAGIGPRIAAVFSTESCALHVRTDVINAAVLSQTDNIAPEFVRQYEEYYYAHDLWARAAAKLSMGAVYLGDELASEKDLRRSEIYDWLKKANTHYIVGSAFSLGGSDYGVIGIHRSRKDHDFGVEDKRWLKFLLPHIARALQIRRELATLTSERDMAVSGLDRLGGAAIICGQDGYIVFANRAAEALLIDADGISAVGGRIAARKQAASDRLRYLISAVIVTATGRGDHSGGYVSLPRRERQSLTAFVCPMRPTALSPRSSTPAALIFIRDPDDRTPPAIGALQEFFGLTPTEAKFVAALVDGKSVEEIALETGRSLHTARTHLKHILAKTGTSRQTELVALVLRSAAGL